MIKLQKQSSNASASELKFSEAIKNLEVGIEELNTLDNSLSTSVISIESVGNNEISQINVAMNDLDGLISIAIEELGMEDISEDEYSLRATAAASAALVGLEPKSTLNQTLVPSASSKGIVSLGVSSNDMVDRSLAKECYSHRSASISTACTCAYNLRATDPGEFIKHVAPLYMINPSDAGIRCVAKLIYIQDDVSHDISGDLTDFNRRSITRAAIDSTILASEGYKMYPVVRNGVNEDHFVDPLNVAPHNVLLQGASVSTAPLAIDLPVNIIGISQTDQDLTNGSADASDQLDSSITLSSLYIGMGTYDAATGVYDKALQLNTSAWSTAQFRESQNGSSSDMQVNFNTTKLRLNKNTVLTDGTLLGAYIPAIDTDDLTIYVTLRASGTVSLTKGDLTVYGNEFKVNAIYNNVGDPVPLDDAASVTLIDAIQGERGGCRIFGYDVDAHLTNLNHSKRGNLIGMTDYVENVFVPLLPPITCPSYIDSDNDTAQVSTLVSLLHTRMDNDAVAMLNNTSDILEDYIDNGIPEVRPDILGIGRIFTKPSYLNRDLDVAAEVMGLSSAERMGDVQAVLVSNVRDFATRLYIDSGLDAVRTGLNNGVRRKPRVVIATDPRIATYLYESGDTRLLGDMFDSKVVISPNNDMKDKIFVFFSDNSGGTNVTPSCTDFAGTAYRPEVVFNLDIPRNGGISRELGVYPSYRIFNITPVLGKINITPGSLTDALGHIDNLT